MNAPEAGDARRAGDGQGPRLLLRSATRAVSQDNRLLAYAEDVVGRRQYTLKVKDLATGKTLTGRGRQRRAEFRLGRRQPHHFYIEKDPVTLLSKRVKAHVLGTPAATDRLVYEEKDDSFYMGVGRTSDDKFICIYPAKHGQQRAALHQRGAARRVARCSRRASASSATRPTMSATAGSSAPTRGRAKNYRLMTLADAAAARGRSAWRDLVPHNPRGVHREFPAVRQLHRHRGARRRQQAAAPARQFGTAQRRRRSDEPAYAMDTRRQSRSRRDQAALHL